MTDEKLNAAEFLLWQNRFEEYKRTGVYPTDEFIMKVRGKSEEEREKVIRKYLTQMGVCIG